MHLFVLVALLCASIAQAAGISADEYAARRAALRKSLERATVVIYGADEDESGELRTGFFQEPNFYYLTGWTQPGAILLMDSDKEMLLLPSHNEKRERFTGRKWAAGDEGVEKATGFATVLATETLESQLFKLLEHSGRVYTLKTHPMAGRLMSALALREVSEAFNVILPLRQKKSEAEIQLLQKAIDVSIDEHRAAWKRMKEGLYEYQIGATMTSVAMEAGCPRQAYAPIIGSGPNGRVLHYFENNRRMQHGELLLIDAGAECSMYAADITRTVPISGKFTPRQKELYEIVLGAQKAAISAIKPGMTIGKTTPNSIHQIAVDYFKSKGLDQYFTHGLSHHVGLEVHDGLDANTPLAEGMVITVEPGLYIPEENIGIRIEDMVLVTKDGGKLLTGALPREVEEIERALRR